MNCRIYIHYTLAKNSVNYFTDKTALLIVMTPAQLTDFFVMLDALTCTLVHQVSTSGLVKNWARTSRRRYFKRLLWKVAENTLMIKEFLFVFMFWSRLSGARLNMRMLPY